MTATERHISHLQRILAENDAPGQFPALSRQNLQDFYNKIAVDHVRVGNTDWQGRCLPALLWHLPNLQPPSQTALIRHVADRWRNLTTSPAPDLPEPQAVERKAGEPSSAKQNQSKSGTGAHVETMPINHSDSHSIRTGTIDLRNDWFDRVTDWVAAFVTLWK